MELFVVALAGLTLQVPWQVRGSELPHPLQDPSLPSDDVDWWKSAVFYQLLPRSFRDSDGDGKGDLRGLLERFDHLIDLGVTGICLGPVFRSPMRDSGYDVSNFREIDPLYGTMEEFEELLLRAKAAGLKVLLDLVPNHTSEQHDWYQKSVRKNEAYRDYYVLRGNGDPEDTELDGEVPNNWQSMYHTSAWKKSTRGDEYYLHQFGETEPDLNYRSPKVKHEMEEIIRFWLDRGVDGIRFEQVNHLVEDAELRDEPLRDPAESVSYENMDHVHTRDLLDNYAVAFDWRTVFDEYAADGGEEDRKVMITSAYTRDQDSALKWFGIANRLGAHIAQNFGFLQTLSNDSRAEDFQRIIDGWLSDMPRHGVANWVLGNHDHRRIASRFGRERAAGLAMLSFTLPGTVFVYYGDEIGMEDNADITWKQSVDPFGCNTNASAFGRYSRDPARTPFQWDASNEWAGFSRPSTRIDMQPWLPVNVNYVSCNLAHEMTSNRSMYHLYRDSIRLRQQSPSIHRGMYQSFLLPDNAFAVLRSLPGERTYATVLNVNPRLITIDMSKVHRYATEAHVAVVTPEGTHYKGERIVDITNFSLGAYETVILEMRSGVMLLRAMHSLTLGTLFVSLFLK